MGQKVAGQEVIPIAEASLARAFEVTEDQIAELRSKFAGITFDTPANYEVGRQAIATLRGLRVKVEKTRVDLKADILERGRLIDKTAKTFSSLVSDIEDPLVEAKRLVDEAEAKAKRDAERAELIALEAEQTRLRLEAEAKGRAEREAEEKRLAAERAALDAEKAKQAAAQREIEAAQEAERQKLAIERAKLDAERRAVDEAQQKARLADEQRAREAREAAAREQSAKDAAAERERLEALRPEREKVHAYADRIRALAEGVPEVESEMCINAIGWVVGRLSDIADTLDRFDK